MRAILKMVFLIFLLLCDYLAKSQSSSTNQTTDFVGSKNNNYYYTGDRMDDDFFSGFGSSRPSTKSTEMPTSTPISIPTSTPTISSTNFEYYYDESYSYHYNTDDASTNDDFFTSFTLTPTAKATSKPSIVLPTKGTRLILECTTT